MYTYTHVVIMQLLRAVHAIVIFYLFIHRIEENGCDSTSPYFPMDELKHFVLQSLTLAMEKGAPHIRDPIGGSNTNLFVYAFYNFIFC